jgi:hypothetical protein
VQEISRVSIVSTFIPLLLCSHATDCLISGNIALAAANNNNETVLFPILFFAAALKIFINWLKFEFAVKHFVSEQIEVIDYCELYNQMGNSKKKK